MSEDLARVRVRATDESKGAFDSMKRSITELDGAFGKLKGMIAGLGVTLSAGGLAFLVRDAVRAQSALDDLSERTSLSVETLSSLQRTADIGGHSLEDISSIASKYAKSVAEAAGGNKELLASFKAIGISQEELRTKRFDELFVEFANKIANAKNQTFAIAHATDLAGKSAATAIPFFKDLAETGLEAARVTAEQAAAAERAEKEWRKLLDVWTGAKNELATGIVPWMTKLLEQMNEAQRMGGFWEFLGQIGGHPWRTAGENIKAITQSIEDFTRARDEALAGGDRERVADMNKVLAGLERQRDFAKFMQRQEALGLTAGDRGRLDARDPGPAGGFNLGAPADRERDRQFQTIMRQLTEEAVKVQELTRFEQVRMAIQRGHFGELNEGQKQQLLNLAAEVDQKRSLRREEEEREKGLQEDQQRRDAEHKADMERLSQLRRAYTDMADPLAKFRRQLAEIHELLARGWVTPDEALAMARAVDAQIDQLHGVQREIEKTNNLWKEMGFTAASAFEDAIVNLESLRQVLQGLLKDLLRIGVRKGVTEPLGNLLGGLLSDIFAPSGGLSDDDWGMEYRAGGGPVVAGRPYMVGETGRELFVPRTSGHIVPNHALAGATVFIDARGADREGMARVEDQIRRLDGSIEQRSVAAVFDANARGARV